MRDRTSHDEPLAEITRTELRRVVDRLGEQGAVRELGVSSGTLARALAGLRLRRVSRTALTIGLAGRRSEPPEPRP